MEHDDTPLPDKALQGQPEYQLALQFDSSKFDSSQLEFLRRQEKKFKMYHWIPPLSPFISIPATWLVTGSMSSWLFVFLISYCSLLAFLIIKLTTISDKLEDLVRRNIRQNLLEHKLLLDCLDARSSSDILPTPPTRLMTAGLYGMTTKFPDNRSRLVFLFQCYEDICHSRGLPSREVDFSSRDYSLTARWRKSGLRGVWRHSSILDSEVSRIVIDVLIEILEGRVGNDGEAGDE